MTEAEWLGDSGCSFVSLDKRARIKLQEIRFGSAESLPFLTQRFQVCPACSPSGHGSKRQIGNRSPQMTSWAGMGMALQVVCTAS